MKTFIVFVTVIVVASAASFKAKRAVQNPLVFDALNQLRGKVPLDVNDQFSLLANARAGQDYPNLATIPVTDFDCTKTHQPGFYADIKTNCQVFRRCDINGNMTSYLCPNMTVFNQITLVCGYFFEVDCKQATKFYDYSNSRLYQNVPFLDDQLVLTLTRAVAPPAVTVLAPEDLAGAEASERRKRAIKH